MDEVLDWWSEEEFQERLEKQFKKVSCSHGVPKLTGDFLLTTQHRHPTIDKSKKRGWVIYSGNIKL